MKINNQRGQTTVEYIMLIAVIVSIMVVIFPRLEQLVFSNPDSLQNKFIDGFNRTINGTNGQYKYFRIPR